MGEIKVTDRRMFTPDGQLREEYERELSQPTPEADELPQSAPPPEPEPPPVAAPEPAPLPAEPFSLPAGEAKRPPTGLLELFQIVGDLTAACLGQAPMPDGRLLLDLEGARFYIDLLGALQERFGPTFPPQDRRALVAFVDQLKLQYVARAG
jgi:Domain of unknown function (DUF1844)